MCKILAVVVAFFLWALANSTFLGRDSLPLVLIIGHQNLKRSINITIHVCKYYVDKGSLFPY